MAWVNPAPAAKKDKKSDFLILFLNP